MQDKISFEDRLKNVEDIAEKLESGKLGLEEMLQAYQNGMNALEVLEKELSEDVKASQFSFARLQNADPVLGVDMSSTGEVGCLGDSLNEAMLNALIATGYKLPKKGILISSGGAKGKVALLEPVRELAQSGYQVYATAGTAKFFKDNDVPTTVVSWPDEEGDNNVLDMIAHHDFDLIINVPKNRTKRELTNGYRIRRGAIDHNIPLMTNVRLAKAFIEAFCEYKDKPLTVKSWQEFNS